MTEEFPIGPNAQFKFGDVIECLKSIPDGSVDLIVTDPPYNIGYKYGGRGRKDDQMKPYEYTVWVEEWLRECQRVLASHGSIYVIAYNNILAEHYWDNMQQLFHYRRWLTWPYKMNYGHTLKNYVQAHRGILYFTKRSWKEDEGVDSGYIFNGKEILIPYEAKSLKAKHVIKSMEKHGRKGRPSYDWFKDINVVQHTHAEKVKMPEGIEMNQIPEELLSIFIKASSDDGWLVLDPFCGTGSTGAAAVKLGRKSLLIDREKGLLEVAIERIKEYV